MAKKRPIPQSQNHNADSDKQVLDQAKADAWIADLHSCLSSDWNLPEHPWEPDPSATPAPSLSSAEFLNRFDDVEGAFESLQSELGELIAAAKQSPDANHWRTAAAFFLRELGTFANEELARLAIAEENEAASSQLAFIAADAANGVWEVYKHDPELLRSLAERWSVFPMNISPHKDSREETIRMLKTLNVGKRAPENVFGKWSNKPTPGQPNRQAIGTMASRLYYLVEHVKHRCSFWIKRYRESYHLPGWVYEAANLPPFSNATSREWFDVGWNALMKATRGRPDTLPNLSRAGETQRRKAKDYGHSVDTQATFAREKIREELWKAFRRRFAR